MLHSLWLLVKFQIEIGFFIKLHRNSKLWMTLWPPSSGIIFNLLSKPCLSFLGTNNFWTNHHTFFIAFWGVKLFWCCQTESDYSTAWSANLQSAYCLPVTKGHIDYLSVTLFFVVCERYVLSRFVLQVVQYRNNIHCLCFYIGLKLTTAWCHFQST